MEEEHRCLHEADFAVMAEGVKNLEKGQERILLILEGNSKNGGLVTKVDNNTKSATLACRLHWLWMASVLGMAVKTIFF